MSFIILPSMDRRRIGMVKNLTAERREQGYREKWTHILFSFLLGTDRYLFFSFLIYTFMYISFSFLYLLSFFYYVPIGTIFFQSVCNEVSTEYIVRVTMLNSRYTYLMVP
jgi:hypothetical protein